MEKLSARNTAWASRGGKKNGQVVDDRVGAAGAAAACGSSGSDGGGGGGGFPHFRFVLRENQRRAYLVDRGPPPPAL